MHSTTADMISISAASSLQGQGSGGPVALADRLPLHVLKRRLAHRRHTLAMQVASYALGATVLLIYVHAGTIPTLLPTAFLLCGITLIGIFALLSETHVNDRFEDHYLTVFQVGGHVAIQLGFLLAAPQIGYAFLNVPDDVTSGRGRMDFDDSRRGPDAGASRYSRWRSGANSGPAAGDHRRPRLERVLARHAGNDFRRRRDAEPG